jgi:RNA-directed DNA polymerase
MKKGNCEITGLFLPAQDVHCHHYIPVHLDGSDKFKNLRILHKEVHKLIHMTDTDKMNTLIKNLGITKPKVVVCLVIFFPGQLEFACLLI